jgi:hypothetical protein
MTRYGSCRARVEHVIARLKDWQIRRQRRRRGNAINDTLHIIAGLWNLKTHNELRVKSSAAARSSQRQALQACFAARRPIVGQLTDGSICR